MDEQFYYWLKDLIREDKVKKFYDCGKWRRLRKEAIDRDNKECQMCRKLGKYHRVDNVHHIKEVKDRPDLALDINNLICLCVEHHNEVHGRYINAADRKQAKLESDEEYLKLKEQLEILDFWFKPLIPDEKRVIELKYSGYAGLYWYQVMQYLDTEGIEDIGLKKAKTIFYKFRNDIYRQMQHCF